MIYTLAGPITAQEPDPPSYWASAINQLINQSNQISEMETSKKQLGSAKTNKNAFKQMLQNVCVCEQQKCLLMAMEELPPPSQQHHL